LFKFAISVGLRKKGFLRKFALRPNTTTHRIWETSSFSFSLVRRSTTSYLLPWLARGKKMHVSLPFSSTLFLTALPPKRQRSPPTTFLGAKIQHQSSPSSFGLPSWQPIHGVSLVDQAPTLPPLQAEAGRESSTTHTHTLARPTVERETPSISGGKPPSPLAPLRK